MPNPERPRARFDALFREHHPAVRAFARRRVPPEDVDDIVSETFLVVWRRLDDVPEAPLPWLLAVARNVVGTEWRGAARRERLWLKAQSWQVERGDCGGHDSDDGRVLAALAVLRERDREALTLVAWDGLTPGQAAAVLGSRRPGFASVFTAPDDASARSLPTCAPPTYAATSSPQSITIRPPPETPHERSP